MRTYQQNTERQEATLWADSALTMLALSGVITGTFSVGAISSLLAADAADGQPDVEVADATVFCAGQTVTLTDDNATESLTILSINYGTNVVTMTGNLVNAYTVADNGVLSGTGSILGATSAALGVIEYAGTDFVILSSASGNFANAETAQQGNGADVAALTRKTMAATYPTANRNRTSPALYRNLWGVHVDGVLCDAQIQEIATDKKAIVANAKQDPISQQATASADLTLTGAEQDVVGATLTLAEPGVYDITGIFDLSDIGDPGETLLGVLSVAGVSQTQLAELRGIATSFSAGTGDSSYSLDTNVRATVAQTWRVTTTAVNTVAKLRSYKTGGAGTSVAAQTHTRILAEQISPAWAATGLTVYFQLFGD